MKDQHKLIKGYRDLTQFEIDTMNSIKQVGVSLENVIELLRNIEGIDKRWVAIGETHLQQGLMALTRAIAKPSNF